MKPMLAAMRLSMLWQYAKPLLTTRTLPDNRVLQKIMANAAIAISFTIMTGMMAGAILIGLLFTGYRYIVSQGLEPMTALGVVMFVALLITAILAMLTVHYMRSLLKMRLFDHMHEHSLAGKASAMVDSFLDGLLTPRPEEEVAVRETHDSAAA